MTTLAAGSSVTITLDGDDVLTTDGNATFQITPTTGGKGEGYLTGRQTLGPYKQYVTIVLTAINPLTYSQASDVDAAEVARYAKDASGNVTGLVSGDGVFKTIQEKRGGSLLRSGKPWLRQPASTTGMTASSGNATIAATTRRGRNCIEVTIAAVTTPQGIHIPIATPQTVTAFQHMVIEVEDAAQCASGNWRLGFFDGSLGTLTNGMQRVLTVGSANAWNGIHLIAPLTTANWISPDTTPNNAVSTSEWAAVGAGAFGSTVMTQIAVRGARAAGPVGTTRFWIYEIAEAERSSLPSIVIGADDGAVTWYTDGLPILEKYGFSSYLAFIADERGTATRMSQAQWADAIARGHHAVVHGCKTGVASLRDYFTSYTGYGSPQAAMEADIRYNRDIMASEGLDPDGLGRTVYVLPQGVIQPDGGHGDNTIVNAMTACGIVGARLARVEGGMLANGGGSGSVMYIPIIGHNYAGTNEPSNISAIIAQLEAEIGAGRSVVFMGHEVRAAPTTQQQITTANLELFVAAAATLVRSGSARAGKLTDLVDELLTYTAPVHIGQ